MTKRWMTLLTVLLGGCLAGCPAMPDVLCDELHLEDATVSELTSELFNRGFEDLGGLFGEDD